jgi:hypothetical protein
MNISKKKQVLLEFIESNKFLPEQGSEEWLNSRLETIGGSEIATILGLNPYQNIKKLISQKIGLSKFSKAAPLWFGNIMEYTLQQYTEFIFNTKIYETGSIQYEKSKYIKYSPDGISVIKKNDLHKILKKDHYDININPRSNFDNTHDDYKDELLILFEFKNPYMRVLKQNEIPVYYKPQPQLGLEVIDICEASIFIESVFRFCSFNDIILQNNKYNTRYHYDKIRYINKPIAYSAFSLYYDRNNNNQDFNNLISNITHYIQNNNMHKYDISNISEYKIINTIMENIVDHKDIKIVYHDMYINNKSDYSKENKYLYYFDKYNNINKFKTEVKRKKKEIKNNDNYIYLGCFCYKMFNINIQPVFKSDILSKELLEKVEKIVNIIKQCNNLNDEDEKKTLINESHKNKYI